MTTSQPPRTADPDTPPGAVTVPDRDAPPAAGSAVIGGTRPTDSCAGTTAPDPPPAPRSALCDRDPLCATFTLGAGRVDLWLVRSPPAEHADALARDELDERERQRAEAFIRPSDGLLYAAAHVALRRLVGRYTATPPQDVRFLREPCPGCGEAHGRPAVAPAPPPLHFSLSHSGGAALVAVAATPLGADIQKLPGTGTVDICSRSLHPDEQTELARAAGDEERRRLFGRIWTRKEAYLKGLGTGLSRSPAEDYLGRDTGRHPRGWTLLDVPCDTTHTAAAALRGAAPRAADLYRVPPTWLTTHTALGDHPPAPLPAHLPPPTDPGPPPARGPHGHPPTRDEAAGQGSSTARPV
ncbi:4'-phosphopantetheinyl transferase family protein [Streptomyces sp. NPDC002911]